MYPSNRTYLLCGLLSAGAFIAIACHEVPATNPFDSRTPAAQQTAGAIGGRIVLPDGFDSARLLDGRVELWQAAAAGRRAQVETRATPTEDGAYVFEGVAAGTYLVRPQVPGLVGGSIPVEVRIGERVDLPPIALMAEDQAPGAIVGTARIEGAADNGHGGTRVEVVGTPWLSLSEPDGVFRVVVPAVVHDLRITRPGYGTESLTGVRVEPETETHLDAEVRLLGEPCRVSGTVALSNGFEGPEWLRAGRIRLRARAEVDGAPDDATTLTAEPDDDGFFLFGADFSDVDLTEVDLTGATLVGVNFSNAELGDWSFAGRDLTDVNLSGVDLSRIDLTGAVLIGAVLRGHDLTGREFAGHDLTGADLSGAILTGADLTQVALAGADLAGADLRGCDLSGVDLTGARFDSADLGQAGLDATDFTGAALTGTSFREAQLVGRDFSGRDLTGVDFGQAVLDGVNFAGATLTDAVFELTDLESVDLTGATLTGASFLGAALGRPRPERLRPDRRPIRRRGVLHALVDPNRSRRRRPDRRETRRRQNRPQRRRHTGRPLAR